MSTTPDSQSPATIPPSDPPVIPQSIPQVAQVVQSGRPRLYHYSGPGGFLGLLKNKKLWLSHINYMNDSEEYSYALTLLEEVLSEFDNVGMHIMYLRSTVEQVLQNIPQVYTFSLSEERDLLSQWRAYCPNGGYSYSFKDEQLDLLLQNPRIELHKCIYRREEQKDFIKNNILHFTPERYKFLAEGDAKYGPQHESKARSYASKDIAESFARNYKLLSVIKHPAFIEEKEWRIIAFYNYQHAYDTSYEEYLNYREGKGMVIPYLEIPIPIAEGNYQGHIQGIGFEEVIVGPTPHKELALVACQMLLVNRHDCRKDNVRSSAIPYRNW